MASTPVYDLLTATATEKPTDTMTLPWLRGIFILLHCIIFLLGISGNMLVVFVVIRNSSMQTITNIFITNLAISHIMMCLLAMPFAPLSAFLRSWVFGEALCRIVPMAYGVSIYVLTLTSTAIAIDRFFVIVYPSKPRMKVFVCVLLIVAIWIISISISLPSAMHQRILFVRSENVYVCYEHWPEGTARQSYIVTNLVLQYVVPCSIITFCYFKVSLVLRQRARVEIGSGSCSRERDQLEIQRKRRTNKMLIAMVSIFACCWLPRIVVHITSEYKPNVSRWEYFVLVFFVAHLIAMSSTIYNPFLYAWMDENFKKEFKQVIPFLFSKKRQGSVMQKSPPRPLAIEVDGKTVTDNAVVKLNPESEKVPLKTAENGCGEY